MPQSLLARALMNHRLGLTDKAEASLAEALKKLGREPEWLEECLQMEARYRQVCDTLLTDEARARILYETAWGYRDLAEPEIKAARSNLIEAEIKKLDGEIDARVYELYGLTESEIMIVEGASS